MSELDQSGHGVVVDPKDIEIYHLKAKVDELTAAVSVLQQVLLEVSHAQQCGSEWYSKGERGLYQQVSMWVRRGQEAIAALKQEVSDDD